MSDSTPPQLLFCHCAHAQILPVAVKTAVLEALAASGKPFVAVPDLCEMSARKDPRLKEITASAPCLRIAACYERAVKWLFHSAEAPLREQNTEIVNLRELSAESAAEKLLS